MQHFHGLQQQPGLVFQGHGKGIELCRCDHAGLMRRFLRQLNRLLRQTGRPLGDLNGQIGNAWNFLERQDRAGGKPPSPAIEDPHPEAAVLRIADAGDPSILAGDGLREAFLNPDIAVFGARGLDTGQGQLSEFIPRRAGQHGNGTS